MDYKKIYESFIKDRLQKKLNECDAYEIHHIIPRCVGGTNDSDNLIKLTPGDHFFAHKLLVKIYEQTNDTTTYKKMLYAANMMAYSSPNGIYRLNHKLYDWLRKKFIENHPMKDLGTRKKASNSHKRRWLEVLAPIYLEKLNYQGIFPFCPLKDEFSNGTWKTHHGYSSKRTKEKQSKSMKDYINSLSPEEKRKRLENSRLKFINDPELSKKRGEAISKAKKGKTTNQYKIMGERFASMTDDEFSLYLDTVSTKVHKRYTNLREKYKNA